MRVDAFTSWEEEKEKERREEGGGKEEGGGRKEGGRREEGGRKEGLKEVRRGYEMECSSL